MTLKGDWKNYQLAIFNMIQNGVKYNTFKGDLVFILSLKEIERKQFKEIYRLAIKKSSERLKNFADCDNDINYNQVFELEIVDSGRGIEEERQKYLFIPFQELKIKQNLKLVKDNTIGMGLACT